MCEPVHIIIVDDNPQDRALVARELAKEFSSLSAHQVVSWEELDEALEVPHIDLVVTDYQLNWSTGLYVLREVKSRHPNCPVLMFTATGSEEVAVEAMKLGLDDYVVKSTRHLVRLRGAARSVLEHSRVERRARDLESRLELLLSRLEVGCFRCTAAGALLEANAAVLSLIGVSSLEEAAGGLSRLFGDPEECRRLLETTIATGQPQQCELEIRQLDRTACYLLSIAVAREVTGRSVLVDGLLEDITARKHAETRARDSAVAAARMDLLTNREREVLEAVIAGKANKVIAKDLRISQKTVEKHRSNLMRKMHAHSVAELVRLALSVKNSLER